jgi:uncharacterized protein with FMN-binding domain
VTVPAGGCPPIESFFKRCINPLLYSIENIQEVITRNSRSKSRSRIWRTISQFLISVLVLGVFFAYILEKPFFSTDEFLKEMASSPTVLPSRLSASSKPAASAVAHKAQIGSSISAPTKPSADKATPPNSPSQRFKDGNYVGALVSGFYGQVQVKVVVRNHAITAVDFLKYPNDRQTSNQINAYAMPVLQEEVIKAQSTQVDTVTGATLTSQAFVVSLQTAIQQAGG